jgi:hypothetical protein
MSIKSNAKELLLLNAEIKKTNNRLKFLRNKKKECENKILEYLKHNDMPGIKINGIVIMSQEKSLKKNKKIVERISASENILQKNGVQNYKQIVKDLFNAMKNENTETTVQLKICE